VVVVVVVVVVVGAVVVVEAVVVVLHRGHGEGNEENEGTEEREGAAGKRSTLDIKHKRTEEGHTHTHTHTHTKDTEKRVHHARVLSVFLRGRTRDNEEKKKKKKKKKKKRGSTRRNTSITRTRRTRRRTAKAPQAKKSCGESEYRRGKAPKKVPTHACSTESSARWGEHRKQQKSAHRLQL
jgi:hypothetical protein